MSSLRERLKAGLDVLRGRKVAVDTSTPSIRLPIETTAGAKFGEVIQDIDREFAATREPIGHFVTYAVAEDMFDNWFEVDDLATKGKDPDFNQTVQAELDRLNAKQAFIRSAIFERTYGWCIIAAGFEDGKDPSTELSGNPAIKDLYVYPKKSITSVKKDLDTTSIRFGLPIIYYLSRGTTIKRLQLHYTRAIHIAPRLSWKHDYEGISVLDTIWDDLTNLRNIRWGMGQTMFRYGSGFPDVTIEGANKDEIDDFIDSKQFDTIHARAFFAHSEKQKLEFKGTQGAALDPQKYYEPILESLSAGTRIPKSILRGAQAGALTGSEVNEREYFKVISSAQTLYEPYIRWLIDHLIASGQIETTVKDYAINWIGGFEVSEREKAAAKLDVSRSDELSTNWLTINEIRAEQGLDPIEGGDIILGILKAQSKIGPPEY